MSEMLYSSQDFVDWLASVPGKTQAQKLNYLQDVLGMAGVDLFGAKQEPFVPGVAPVNQIEVVWGQDPAMAAIMDFMQFDGMSPKSAVDEARKQGLIPEYDPYNKGEVDYMDLASQFAAEEAKRSQWEVQNQADFAAYEATRKPGLNDLFQTPYQQMGSPSVDDLMAAYAKDIQRYSSASLPNSQADKAKVRAMSPAQRQDYLAEKYFRKPKPPASVVKPFKPVGVGGMNVSVVDEAKRARDAQQVKAAKDFDARVRKSLENRIALNQRGSVATERGQEVMRNIALLALMGN